MRKVVNKIERKLFDLLKFDTLGYDYQKPKSKDPDEIRLVLLNDYFKRQPGLLRISVVKIYLFVKKSVRFVLRRILRFVRRK